MINQLSSKELDFLARKGLYTEIARQIKSPRARRPGATVSDLYVRKILRGEGNTGTDTAIEVINLAKTYVNALLYNS